MATKKKTMTPSRLAAPSWLSVAAHRSPSRAKESATAHLAAYLNGLRASTPRRVREFSAAGMADRSTVRDEVDELIAALAVLGRGGASEADRSAALDKLTAHFDALLDSQEKMTSVREKIRALQARASTTKGVRVSASALSNAHTVRGNISAHSRDVIAALTSAHSRDVIAALGVIADPHALSSQKEEALATLNALVKSASASPRVSTTPKEELNELIDALGVIADPKSSAEERTAANDHLIAYFSSPRASKESASALASQSRSLGARIAKLEAAAVRKGTAIRKGTAPRRPPNRSICNGGEEARGAVRPTTGRRWRSTA